MLSNLAETLHSLWKSKSSQTLKSLTLKQRIGATISFPEGLEDTPFTKVLAFLGCAQVSAASHSFLFCLEVVIYSYANVWFKGRYQTVIRQSLSSHQDILGQS